MYNSRPRRDHATGDIRQRPQPGLCLRDRMSSVYGRRKVRVHPCRGQQVRNAGVNNKQTGINRNAEVHRSVYQVKACPADIKPIEPRAGALSARLMSYRAWPDYRAGHRGLRGV